MLKEQGLTLVIKRSQWSSALSAVQTGDLQHKALSTVAKHTWALQCQQSPASTMRVRGEGGRLSLPASHCCTSAGEQQLLSLVPLSDYLFQSCSSNSFLLATLLHYLVSAREVVNNLNFLSEFPSCSNFFFFVLNKSSNIENVREG